ncbi:MAG: shikimate dehydrogenase [Clostridia bacterium]|nr:shikimate dehydrogenase [Clostridia bacterium]
MKYCLIGEKLGHSYSVIIHEKRGYDYILRPIERNYLCDFCKEDWDGFNITIPYKKDIMQWLDFVSDDAKEIGAVNTVKRENGKLFGYNTDLGGLKYTFDRIGVSLNNQNVLVLGSGGASKVAVALAKKEGARSVNIVSRTVDINYQNVYEKVPFATVIINTTPVGMFPNADDSPISLDGFENLIAVVDAIYNPYQTKLLIQAQRKKLKFSNGLPMLVEQGLIAEDIWSNTTHTKGETEDIINYLVQKTMNVVLFGMPSCGKTTLGRLVSHNLDREFIDTDELIKEKTGKSPATLIKESGEKVFRDIESDVIKSVAKLSGKVISLGGGGVLREENVDALRQNGIMVYVDRALELLVDDDRPITKQKGVQKLFAERKDIYERAKDICVTNNGNIENAMKEIIEKYGTACHKRS